MAGRKKEGLDRIKNTTGGKRRDDKQIIGRTSFDPLTVDAKNVLTVLYLLQSPEDNVRLRAIASLELFGRKDPENLVLLSSLKIVEYAFPLLNYTDYIARRFTLKLLAMLSSLESFREKMLKVENVLNIFVDILRKETDLVTQEFSALILANLSIEYHVASELLKVDNCVETLLIRIVSSDPDIERNCLDIMSHLLNDINGIEVFIETPGFEMKFLLNLVSSNYPLIQKLVIEVLIQLTSWCRDTRVLFAFRDAMGIEVILQVLETSKWADLHPRALDLFLNVTDNPEICEYLLQSGCLYKFIVLLDKMEGSLNVEKILGVLARMSQTQKGREALYSIEMETRFISYLEVPNDNIQEASCLGLANLAQYVFSLNRIVAANPTKNLLEIIYNDEKNLRFRNVAAYALNVLANAEKKAATAVLQEEYQGLFTILTDNSSLPTELCQNVIQVFIGISLYEDLRTETISENFISALMSCLPRGHGSAKKDPALQVDALECLSEYLVESEARSLLHQLNGVELVLNCLRSRFASVREWAGYLVAVASQNKDFVKDFIEKNGLEWMIKEKNTLYSMPSWNSAIETIFASYLPAKFAFTGRLDFEDVTQDGFYISVNPKMKFIVLDHLVESSMSPISPVYVANFNANPTSSEESKESSLASSLVSVREIMEPPDLKKFKKIDDRNPPEEIKLQASLNSYISEKYEEPAKLEDTSSVGKYLPDPYLTEYVDILKKRIAKEELAFGDASWSCVHPKVVSNRARIIAEFVAEEMSGSDPYSGCSAHYKTAYINEMKNALGTNVIPLGLIRTGDYLERAMLFKVLADRTGFPCALVRGSYARAWIEICVPVISVEDPEENLRGKLYSGSLSSEGSASSETESQYPGESRYVGSVLGEEDFWFPKICPEFFKGFPNNFLKPNALVDLMVRPGRIMCINSVEAEEYRGDFLFQKN